MELEVGTQVNCCVTRQKGRPYTQCSTERWLTFTSVYESFITRGMEGRQKDERSRRSLLSIMKTGFQYCFLNTAFLLSLRLFERRHELSCPNDQPLCFLWYEF